MARAASDATLQRDIKHLSYKVVNKGGRPAVEVKIGGKAQTFAPEEIRCPCAAH